MIIANAYQKPLTEALVEFVPFYLPSRDGMRVLLSGDGMRVLEADWFQIVIARFQTIFSYSCPPHNLKLHAFSLASKSHILLWTKEKSTEVWLTHQLVYHIYTSIPYILSTALYHHSQYISLLICTNKISQVVPSMKEEHKYLIISFLRSEHYSIMLAAIRS